MNRLMWGLSFVLIAASAIASLQSGPVMTAGNGDPGLSSQLVAYVRLQRELDASIPAPTSPVESERRVERQRALASALVAARRDAHQGDIFTPTVAARMRSVIGDALAGPEGDNIRRTLSEGDLVILPPLRVNDLYPENAPLVTMPPTLLRQLPALPMELAYRIVGRSLVLTDVETNVIVDILPDAVPSR